MPASLASCRACAAATASATGGRERRGERGVVLALVLVMALLLVTAVTALQRRALVDAQIALNRDDAAQALALARGGVRLGTALLVADELGSQTDDGAPPGDTLLDPWAQARHFAIAAGPGATLRLDIHDAGARVNLNALVPYGEQSASDESIEYGIELLSKVIDEMPIPPGEKVWDPRELTYNLVDYIDADDVRVRGGAEDDYYLSQDPPYHALNGPLRTVDELALVEGFDARLVDALRPYATVHPRGEATGINLNTAPPWVLAAVFHGSQGSRRLASEDTVRRILRLRDEGRILCDTQSDDRCILTNEVVDGAIYPPSPLPAEAKIFSVVAEATVGEIRRSIEAVVDRSDPASPQVLSWRSR